MTDGVFPDRLSQLRVRWEADPSSRIFLQLAEEYRHLGRVQDALAVLERGLKEHPGYLSALVAKGRCHIELGESENARVVLERVVKQDATQMVANKLLVRAYLETGDPVRARERLDLYTLLNDSDPEIDELRRRINQLEAPVPAAVPDTEPTLPETRFEAQPEAAPEGPSPMDADPFSLEPPPPSAPAMPSMPPAAPAAAADIFDLDARSAPLRGGDDIFQLEPAPFSAAASPPPVPRTALATSAPPALDDPFDLAPLPRVQEPMGEEEDSDLPFPQLGARDSRSRYLDALASEGLFSFELPPPTAAPEREPFAVFPDTATPLPAFASVGTDLEPDFEPAPIPRVEEASWLDEAAASSSFASSPVPVLPLEPLAPAILAPVAPVPSELQPREMREPEVQETAPAEDLWRDEPLPEAEPWVATAAPEPEPFDFEPGPPPVFEEPAPISFEPAPPMSFEPEPAPFEATALEPAPHAQVEEPIEEPASEPPATVTLGDLYLRQGYHAEAEGIYREVLEREPENAAARAGLERIAALGPRPEPPEVDARRLLVGYRPDPGLGTDAELRARKTFVLNRYMERLRQGDMHDVS
jgi:tetratricopeptide (TPR) repeat protein